MEAPMRDRLLALFARWRALQEIEAMSDRDLADLGMTRDQILDFASAPADTEQRMAAMARIFGLSMDELRREYATYLDMVQTCGHCSAGPSRGLRILPECPRLCGSCRDEVRPRRLTLRRVFGGLPLVASSAIVRGRQETRA
jgi:uncharacterized protein YjiS (DUF1127 family)